MPHTGDQMGKWRIRKATHEDSHMSGAHVCRPNQYGSGSMTLQSLTAGWVVEDPEGLPVWFPSWVLASAFVLERLDGTTEWRTVTLCAAGPEQVASVDAESSDRVDQLLADHWSEHWKYHRCGGTI